MPKETQFYRGGMDHKIVAADNGARVNSDFKSFITNGPWAQVKTQKVGPKIHTITGYGLSNYTFIEGEEGLILIDTGLNAGSGLEILKMKEAFSDKPISAIIYTHHHYTAGSRAIVSSFPERSIPIYGHPDIDKNLLGLFSFTAAGSFRRGNLQFGHSLPDKGPDAEYGIPEPEFEDASLNARGHMPVSHPVKDGEEVIIDGVKVIFHHAIADTEDSLIIQFPELDAIVHNTAVMPFLFPMYTLRGDYYRSPPEMLASIDKLRSLKPEYLIGCHGNPIIGREEAYKFATVHRDALAFIFQQTVQGINRGLGPDEIARRVKLPEAFSKTPELYTAYVDVEHMVRGIYRGIIGWWANDPAELHPPEASELAQEIVDGFGGENAILDRAQSAHDGGRYNLAASLATYVLDHDPGHTRARQVKADALRKMAYATPTGIQTRNFMLAEALRLEGKIDVDSKLGLAPSILTAEMVAQLPPETFLQSLTHTIDAESAADLILTVKIDLTDIDRSFALFIRNGANEFKSIKTENYDIKLSLDIAGWAKIAAGEKSLKASIDEGSATLSGDAKHKEAFLRAYTQVM